VVVVVVVVGVSCGLFLRMMGGLSAGLKEVLDI